MKIRFVHLSRHIDVTHSMKCPRYPEVINEWLKQARKAVSDIPQENSTWRIQHFSATEARVVIELWNGVDKHTKGYDFCHIIINRLKSSLEQ